MSHTKQAVEPENIELASYSIAELKPENNGQGSDVSPLAELRAKPEQGIHSRICFLFIQCHSRG